MLPFRATELGSASPERMRAGWWPRSGDPAFVPRPTTRWTATTRIHAGTFSHTATVAPTADMARRMAQGWCTCTCVTAAARSPTSNHLVPGRGTQPTAEVKPDAGRRLRRPRRAGGVHLARVRPPNANPCWPSRCSSPALTAALICRNTANALFTTAMALRPLDSDPGNPACRGFLKAS